MSNVAQRPPISPWVNPVIHALREGKTCVGFCSISFPSAAVAQIAAQAGFGFFYFDMEHSGLSIDGVTQICTAAKLAGIVPIAGTSGIADFVISRPLDNGAMGVIVPHVNTRDEAQLVVNACRYAPQGTRGLINLAASTNYANANDTEWVANQNQEILVAVKVESARGIENIEDIASVPGLDAILIGPGDLSASYGVPGQAGHPMVRGAIERMLAACAKNRIAGGPHVGNAEAAMEWADRGATFMSCGFDGGILLDAAERIANEVHHELGKRAFAPDP